MTTQQQNYRDMIMAYGKGDKPLSALPVNESEFWASAVVRASRPGRASLRAPNLGVTAERLLRGPLAAKARSARTNGVVQALFDSDVRTRREAIHLLREYEITPSIVEAAAKAVHDTDKDVQVGALFLLATGGAGKATDQLLDILNETSDFRSTIASEALVSLGKRAVPGLSKLLESSDANIRWRATMCLARIADVSAEASLLRAFHDDSPNVAWVAADGLLLLGPSVRVDVLKSVLNDRLTNAEVRALHHYSEHASPASVFRELERATSGLAAGSATLVAVNNALEKLEGTA